MSTRATKVTARDVSNDSNFNMAQEQPPRKGLCSLRHGLALILQLCNFSIYTQQMNLSIAITAMVNTTEAPSQPNASTERSPTDSQDYWNETLRESKAVAPVYNWTPEIQGILLSSLNYGSFLAPIPTGYVAGVFGAKYVVGAGLLVSSVLTLFIPLAADAGVALLIVLRVIQGIAQVMVLTGQYSIWVKWAPPLERSQLTTIAGSGSMLGTFLVLIAGGLLCQNLGWPYIFYLCGGIGCVCCLIWFPLVYDDPQNHPFISTGEKRYIVCSLAHEDCAPGWSLPIGAMIKSLPLWALVVSYFCEYWLFSTIMAYTPTYISSVLQANLRDIFSSPEKSSDSSPSGSSSLPWEFLSLRGSSCPCPGSGPAAAPPWPSWYCPRPSAASANQEPSLTSWTLLLGTPAFSKAYYRSFPT
ncbi:probable small intestine urate exporter isoform X3 [Nannospalax galili]|uniref:probable small intestine urate exporter isoform X3 n=1 Tax=Nannospalax galili TaxID=1026970 RepID=UPI00111BDF5D|nr:probable small intestine urate exporter isoform X3 [Nannospalax galili]